MPATQQLPYLSEQDLATLGIATREVIDAIEQTIALVDAQRAWSAPKAVILTEDGRYMMAALAAADEPQLLAVKTLVLNPRNPERDLPQINGLVTLLDSDTGLPVAILDANWITAVRTAGLSAVAAKRLARKDARSLALIGCGVQARSHLHAFAELFPLEKVLLFGRGWANIDRTRTEADRLGLRTDVCEDANTALADADLVVSSLTYAPGMAPFLDPKKLKPGAFATVTDLAAPWFKEDFAALDRVVIDDLEQEAAMPNKLLPEDLISGDLAGLVLGRLPGRQSPDERTAFVFRGHAMGDLALAMLAWQRWQQARGARIP